eukprot:5363272-Pyramimonas_sp.AAC.1
MRSEREEGDALKLQLDAGPRGSRRRGPCWGRRRSCGTQGGVRRHRVDVRGAPVQVASDAPRHRR